MSSKARRATQLQDAFKVQGVPAIGIAGRYYTDGTLAGNMDRALQVTDYLIAEARKASERRYEPRDLSHRQKARAAGFLLFRLATMPSKIHAFMKHSRVPLSCCRCSLFVLLSWRWPAGGRAEKADRNKPMNVEADALRYDDLKQTSVFTGKVVVTKGTIVIRGARVDVRQDPEGYQYGVVTAEPGKLAFYRQKREGVDEFIEGEGETIEYDGKADRVKFIKRAELRRYRGAVAERRDGRQPDHLRQQHRRVHRGRRARPARRPGGRVRAVLAPRAGASAPAAAAPVQPPAQLRPSTTLDGDKK